MFCLLYECAFFYLTWFTGSIQSRGGYPLFNVVIETASKTSDPCEFQSEIVTSVLEG